MTAREPMTRIANEAPIGTLEEQPVATATAVNPSHDDDEIILLAYALLVDE
jgi:hypothetical protein